MLIKISTVNDPLSCHICLLCFQGLQNVLSGYENALIDIATSFQLSRNIFVALLSLQSWKFFMQRWFRAIIMSIDAKAESIVPDRTFKAANDILKVNHCLVLLQC